MGRKERGSGENESPVYYRQYLKKKKSANENPSISGKAN